MTQRFRFCLEAAKTLREDDLNDAAEKIQAYRAQGMDDRASEIAAIDDVIAQASADHAEMVALLHAQHPDLFTAPVKPEQPEPAAPKQEPVIEPPSASKADETPKPRTRKIKAVSDRDQAAIDKMKAQRDELAASSAALKDAGDKAAAADATAKAKAVDDLKDALGELGDILGKPFRLNITPEEEKKMLPVLVRVFDAAFRLGNLKFKDAARFVLDKIREHFGNEVANEITLDHLQGAYISMAGRYRDQGADRAVTVAAVESKAEIDPVVARYTGGEGTEIHVIKNDAGYAVSMLDADTGKYLPTLRQYKGGDALDKATAYAESIRSQEISDVPSPDTLLERDRADAAPADAAVGGTVPVAGPDEGPAAAGGPAGSSRRGRPDDPGVPAGGPAAGREPGDQPVHRDDGSAGPEIFDAGSDDRERGDLPGFDGIQADAFPAEQVEAASLAGMDDVAKRAEQRAADAIPVVPGDLDNIRATLPYLLPEQQDDVLKAETRFAKPTGYGMLFTNGTGTGKAQPLDAKLMTPTGWVRMGDIVPGDMVIGADGAPTRVLSVHPQGDKPIYRVTFSDGAATECCDEHLWETQTLYARRKAAGNPAWECAQPKVRQLSEIRATLNEQHFIPIAAPLDLQAADLPIPAYIMGALLGDGCITQNTITFATADPEIAERVERDLPDKMHLRLIEDGKRCPQYRISLIDQVRRDNGQMEQHPWLRALREMSLHGCTSATKFVPDTYLRGSIQQRTELLQGLLDTDGWVDMGSRSPYFTSVSLSLAEAVAFLARSLGGVATINTKRPTYHYQGEKHDGQLAYNVCINLPSSIAPFSLERKAALYQPNTKYPPRRKIVDVEPIGVKPAQCIAVEHPRHLYVTDDCILTHNTFTGLGIVKRSVRQGKGDVLIVVPDAKIMADWVKSGRALGLDITSLEDTKSAGSGVSITTYANLGQNDELARREWDLVVPDEAHLLKQSSGWDSTLALDALRAITWHPEGAYTRHSMLFRDEIAERAGLSKEIEANSRIANNDDTMDAMRDHLLAENERLRAQWSELNRMLEGELDKIKATSKERQGAARTRVAMLSATPFAYEETVTLANGYLLDFEDGYPEEMRTSQRYNTPSPRDLFYMTHFAWYMKTGKLNQPGPKVNRGLLQRQFNTWLKAQGSLLGRQLEVKPDYDRRFLQAESRVGNEIDRAIEWLRERDREEAEAQKNTRDAINGYAMLKAELDEALCGKRGHLTRRYLLEAIKAKEVIPHVRAHLAAGRKVVVFHDFKKGGSVNPFAFEPKTGPVAKAEDSEGSKALRVAYNLAAAEFRKEFPDLAGDKLLADLRSPVERFTKEFPDVLLINGDQKPADLLQRYTRFNEDQAGPVVALVQSEKNRGWSGHDTTGKHPRVLFNLGLPTKPTTSIQQEGRIYRVGQATDAMFRYLNTGTNWERWAFAQTIAQRTGAVENLAAGELARAMQDSFIAAFEESGDFPVGYEGEGTGGKARDRAASNALSEYDRAKAFYWGTEKKNSRTKAAEGHDYFATPEPVGLKMVQWTDLRGGEDALEPSGGHGAIARWLPETTTRTAIEPSSALGSRMALVFDGKIIRGDFESLHTVNKFDGVTMNPPFGTAGKTAIDHLAKAATHLRDYGRVTALIPEGPAADKKFDAWFYGESSKPVKPLATINIGMGDEAIYRGDTVKSNSSFVPGGVITRYDPRQGSQYPPVFYVKSEGEPREQALQVEQIVGIARTGPRTETFKPAEHLRLVAEFKMPAVTFERAGTAVRTRIVVIDKLPKGVEHTSATRKVDLSSITDIGELFDRLEHLEVPPRLKVEAVEVPEIAKKGPVDITELQDMHEVARGEAKTQMSDAIAHFERGDIDGAAQLVYRATRVTDFADFTTQAAKLVPRLQAQAKEAAKAAKAQAHTMGAKAAEVTGLEVVKHTVQKTGKVIEGVIARHLSESQAREISPYTWRKDGGWFIRTEHVAAMMQKYPPPGTVAGEERAVYAVNEPAGDIPLDLFPSTLEGLQALPSSPRVHRGGKQPRAAKAGNVQPASPVPNALAVRQDPIFPGLYHLTSQLVEVGRRDLPVAKVTNWQEAASALAAMRRYAVEHFDVLITDKDGKPLAVVGAFKGARAVASVFPPTMLAEALRIEGATDAWGVHNHPSGSEELSRADEHLNMSLAGAFGPSSVRWRGLAAVGAERFMAVGNDGNYQVGVTLDGTTKTSIPVVERTIMPVGDVGKTPAVTSPQLAKSVVTTASTGKPGIMFLNSQNQLTAWVPVDPSEIGSLRTDGRFDKLINSASEAGAGAAIIANPGGVMPQRTLNSIASALKLADIQTLDAIDTLSGKSDAEQGNAPSANGVILSRAPQPFYSALSREIGKSPMKAGAAGAWSQALKGMVSSGKVKADEVAWTGIEEWLQLQDGKVSKAQVEQFLQANGVQVTETLLTDGAHADALAELEAAKTDFQSTGWTYDVDYDGQLEAIVDPAGMWYYADLDADNNVVYLDKDEEEATIPARVYAAAQRLGAAMEADGTDKYRPAGTKYSQYTLPGGSNYRELLLTLPSKPDTLRSVPHPDYNGDHFALAKPDGSYIMNPQTGRPMRWDSQDLAERYGKRTYDEARQGQYQSGHWDTPNVLAHIRVDDRVDAEGRKVLMVQELQSDWGQQGKKRGFAGDDPHAAERESIKKQMMALVDERADARKNDDGSLSAEQQAERLRDITAKLSGLDARMREIPVPGNQPPRAPFVQKTDAWVGLALKRIVKMAVDEGYDRVAFVTGEQAAKRFSLDTQVRSITAYKRRDGNFNLAGFALDGRKVDIAWDIPLDKVEEHIGKEMAQKIEADLKEADHSKTYSGDDLKIEAKGMRAFYDSIVPNIAKDVLRKVGSSAMKAVEIRQRDGVGPREDDGAGGVVQRTVPGGTITQPGFDVTPTMRERASGGLPLFKRDAPMRTQIADAVKTMAEAGLRVNVAATIDDLPPARRALLLDKDPSGTARGAFFPGADEVWLISGNMASVDELVFVALHESFHRGLHNVMGEQGAALLGELYAANKRVRELADEQMAVHGIGKLEAINEALADLAGSGEATGLSGWEKLKRMIRELVDKVARAVGVKLDWSDDRVLDLVAYLTNAGLQGKPNVTGESTSAILGSLRTRAAVRWSERGRNTEGPEYYGNGVGLIAIQELSSDDFATNGMHLGHGAKVRDGHTVHRFLIADTDGSVLGEATLEVDARGNVEAIHDIVVDDKRNGIGRRVVESILASAPGPVRIIDIVDGAQAFWDRMGAGYKDFYGDSTTDWAELQGQDARAVQGRRQEAGRRLEAYPGSTGQSEEDQATRPAGRPEQRDVAFLSRAPRRHTPEQLAALAKAGQRPKQRLKDSIISGWRSAQDAWSSRSEIADSSIQNTLDQFHGIKRAIERDVGNLPVEQDGYITARLANGGTASVMRALLIHGQARWSANHQHLEKIPETRGLLDILKPLGDDLPDFFGWMVGNRAARLLAEGRERNLDATEIALLQGLADTPERLALFRETAKEYAAFKRSVLDVAEGAGLIDAEARRVWDHADYIPFYRQVDDRALFSATGKKGLAGQSSGIRQLKGGESRLNDPVENLLMTFSRLIDASLKNNALDVTIKALEGAESEAISRASYDMRPALVLRPEIKRVLIEGGTPEDLVEFIPPEVFDGIAKMWSIQAPSAPDVIRLMRDGKAVYYQVHDPLLLKAATSFVPFDFPGLGLARLFKRVLTGAVTSTPEFMIRNFIRDSTAVHAITRDGMSPWKSITGVVKAFNEDGGAEAMLFAGASFQGGNIGGADPTSTARSIRRALRQKGLNATAMDGFMATIVDNPAKAWELYRKIGESVENGNREAVFEAAIKAGKSITAAAYEAKDMMDFSLRGSHPIYQVAADVLPFFNARTQGMYRLGRSDPKRVAVYAALMATVSVGLLLANSGEPWYEELPDWDKDAYWHMQIGGVHFRLPKPFELGVAFATIPERVVRYMKGIDSGKKAGARLWANIRDQLAFDPMPQLIRPAENVLRNRDPFRDMPIETAGDEKKLPHMRYSGNTSPTIRTVTRGLAHVDELLPSFAEGALDISPKMVEHLVGGYLGTAGLYALGLSDMAVRALEGYPSSPAMRVDDLPVVKSFIRMDPARGTVFESDIYKVREKVDQVYASIMALAKQGDWAGAEQLMKQYPREVAARGLVDNAAKALAGYNAVRDQIMRSDMTPAEKRQALDELQQQKNDMTAETMRQPALEALK